MTQHSMDLPIVAPRGRSITLRSAVRAALHVVTPAALLLMSAAPAMAGPQDGTVVRGAAAIDASAPNVVNVNQTTDRAVINWRSFSIGADEQVNFNQPSSSSATLNRVLGGQRSLIEGALSANGQVFLLNTSGVMFSSTARVDVGGLVATSSTIRDDDFMAGNFNFVASGQGVGEVVNEGTITIRDGGMAALVAPSVRNSGVISARLGRIALGAGETYTLDLYGDQLINFALPGPAGGELQARAVDQAGALIADGGQVLLTTDAAAGIVGGAVNMSGIVQARTVGQNERGEIVLGGGDSTVIVSGRADASGSVAGQQGGDIDVFGQTVQLSGSASIDATGASGGGNVRIGGGFAGDDAPRADSTVVAEGATIDVSATNAGNAGTVAVWGNDSTQFAGTIRARGGENGGDGGFVEVSSKGLLQFLGDAITDAPAGHAGVVLLDPPSIRVEATGSIDPNSAIVSAAALNGMLRRGTPVILLADESITVNAIIDGRSPNGAGPSGRVEMTAGSIIVMRPVLTERNSITLNATTGNVTFGANAYLYVADSTSASTVGTSAITINAAGSVDARSLVSLGQVSVTATTGNVALAGQFGASTGGGTGIGSLTVNAGGNVNLHGARTSGAVAVTAGGSINNSDSAILSEGAVALNSGADIQLDSGGTGAAVDSASSISLQTDGAVTLANGIRANGSIEIGRADARVASLSAAAGAALQSAGTVSVFSGAAVDLRGVSGGGAITINTDGRLSNSESSIVAAGPVTLIAGADAGEGIDLAAPSGTGGPRAAVETTAANAAVELRTGGDVAVGGGIKSAGGAIRIGVAGAPVNSLTLRPGTVLQTFTGSTPAGSIDILSTGNVAAQGTASAPNSLATGSLNITSATGDIALDSLYGLNNAGTASGIGSLTLNAGGDVNLRGARTSGAISVTAAGGISNDTASIVSDGNVELTAGADGIAMADLAGAPAIDARSTADVTLRTSGAVVLDSGIRTAAGDIVIGSNTANGRVASLRDTTADSGFTLEAGGAGTINTYAGGEVSLRGAAAGGAINIDTSGRLANLQNSIRSTNGSIDLVAGGDDGEGIDVRSGGNFAVLDAGAGAQVNLRTSESVTVGGGIRTIGGDINVGSDQQRVESFTLLPGGFLQTFGTSMVGSVDIFSEGAINARGDLSNPTRIITNALNLDSEAGDIDLDALVGLDVNGRATGIGSLTATTGGAGGISVRQVEIGSVAGGVSLTAGTGGIEFLGNGSPGNLALRVRQGNGSISLQTPGEVVLADSLSTASGNITIGSNGSPVSSLSMQPGSELRTQAGDVSVFLGEGASTIGSVVGGAPTAITVRSGSTVEFLGAVGGVDPDVVSDDPTYLDVEADGIVYRGAETSGGNANGVGVRLAVTAGGRVDLLGETRTHGGGSVLIGRPTTASNADINLSHNILTDGTAVVLNGNVKLFDGIGRWGSAPDGISLERALDSTADANAFLAEVFALRARGLDDPPQGFDSNSSVVYAVDPRLLCVVSAGCNPGPEDLMRFIGSFFIGDYDSQAYDSNGLVTGFADFAAGNCLAWICGYHHTADRSLTVLRNEARLREERYRRLLGSLTARIDTTRNNAVGGNVSIAGSVSRHVGARLDPLLADVVALPDSYVNHELVLAVGGAQATVAGTFGDTAQQSELTYTIGNRVAPPPGFGEDQRTLETIMIGANRGGMPELGQFSLVIESGTLDIQSANTNRFVNRITGNGTLSSANLGENRVAYLFPNPWTSPSNGALRPGTPPPPGTPFDPPDIGPDIGGTQGGPGGNTPPPNGPQSGTGSGTLGPGTAVVGAGAGGAGTDVSSDNGALSFGLLSTADDQQRDDEAEDDDNRSNDTRSDEESNERCARGAAQEADLGATRSVDGAAADVFERCPEGS